MNPLKQNLFFAGYAYLPAVEYSQYQPGVVFFNVMKGIGYIPIVGAIAYTILGISITCTGHFNFKESSSVTLTLLSRYVITVLAPFILPLVDVIATVWFYVKKSKKSHSSLSLSNSAVTSSSSSITAGQNFSRSSINESQTINARLQQRTLAMENWRGNRKAIS